MVSCPCLQRARAWQQACCWVHNNPLENPTTGQDARRYTTTRAVFLRGGTTASPIPLLCEVASPTCTHPKRLPVSLREFCLQASPMKARECCWYRLKSVWRIPAQSLVLPPIRTSQQLNHSLTRGVSINFRRATCPNLLIWELLAHRE